MLPNSDVEADVALAALGTTQLNASRYADSGAHREGPSRTARSVGLAVGRRVREGSVGRWMGSGPTTVNSSARSNRTHRSALSYGSADGLGVTASLLRDV